LLIPMVLWFAA